MLESWAIISLEVLRARTHDLIGCGWPARMLSYGVEGMLKNEPTIAVRIFC